MGPTLDGLGDDINLFTSLNLFLYECNWKMILAVLLMSQSRWKAVMHTSASARRCLGIRLYTPEV